MALVLQDLAVRPRTFGEGQRMRAREEYFHPSTMRFRYRPIGKFAFRLTLDAAHK
jgi:hypothetical protein